MADLETALLLLQSEPHCSVVPVALTHLYCQYLAASNQVPMAVGILSRVTNLGGVGQLALYHWQERHSLQPSGLDFSLQESCVRAVLAWSGDNTARSVTLVGAVCGRLLPEFRGDGMRAIRHLLGLSLLPLHGLEVLANLDEASRLHLWILYFLLARIKLADGELVDADQMVKEFLQHGLTALKAADPLGVRLFGLLTLKLMDFGISDAVYFDLIYNFLVEEAPLSLTLAEQSPWLVEFVQNIRLQRIMYRGEFVQFLFSLVEMYGFTVLPSICRNLIIVKETALALKLCDVLRSDQMPESRYWELYICMWIQCQKTVQLLYEALNCVPSSEILWFYMTQLTNYSVVRGWKPQILELAKRCSKTAVVNDAWSKAKHFFTKNS
ncbi:hypothetical protein Ciccas_000693 [Cichlidogyrus casuarinus]|uniref:Uncharacterized protein n=1 Tax=Cichlidogyrus casuarinus TaxID=1844966 RepID=A0ABD2QM49_9PLAT